MDPSHNAGLAFTEPGASASETASPTTESIIPPTLELPQMPALRANQNDGTDQLPSRESLGRDIPNLPVHPVADVFPLLSGKDFEDLKQDIAKHGQLEPIAIDEHGSIIDGRNRYAVCQALGLAPKAKRFSQEDLASHGGVTAFIISKNLRRRHLDASQRAMVASRLATLHQGETKTATDTEISVSQPEAAHLMRVSTDLVQMARVVDERGAPELKAAVCNGTIAVSAAKELVDLAADEQAKLATQPKRAPKVASALRKARHVARKQRLAHKKSKPTDVNPANGYGRVISAIADLLRGVPPADWNEILRAATQQARESL